jgi:hypothetical protein
VAGVTGKTGQDDQTRYGGEMDNAAISVAVRVEHHPEGHRVMAWVSPARVDHVQGVRRIRSLAELADFATEVGLGSAAISYDDETEARRLLD